MVYVLNKDGHPLMPTKRYGKIRRMLRDGQAKVIHRCPFTIQLLYETTELTQEISLGVDAGSKHIGLSATTKTKVLYESDIELRNDIVNLLSTRRESRRTRRSRKTRHRKVKFQNRRKPKGWLVPSIRQKIDGHMYAVRNAHKILPVSKIVVEVAAFDMQKLKADMKGLQKPEGTDYQQGDQLGFWNAREYVLFRDHYTCQCCKGKSGDKVLEVHHMISRKIGGDAPDNLITLCKYCHDQYHLGNIKFPKKLLEQIKFLKTHPVRDAAFMGIMRWAFYGELKQMYPDVKLTYGYITKNTRIENHLKKDHYVDARCISGNPLAEPSDEVFYQKKIRCHNRQIHKFKFLKGGVRKRNQAEYKIYGFRLFDKVEFDGKVCFVYSRRIRGNFNIRELDGTVVHTDASYKKLKFLETRHTYITERRPA